MKMTNVEVMEMFTRLLKSTMKNIKVRDMYYSFDNDGLPTVLIDNEGEEVVMKAVISNDNTLKFQMNEVVIQEYARTPLGKYKLIGTTRGSKFSMKFKEVIKNFFE